jgi:one cut domain, family member 1 (hepatocyte nuclear factor 6)
MKKILFSDTTTHVTMHTNLGCKRKEEPIIPDHMPQPKKPRLVFTDLQRRTLQAIFKVSLLVLVF